MTSPLIRLVLFVIAAGIGLAESPSARSRFYATTPGHDVRSWVGMKTTLLLRREVRPGVCQFRDVAEDFQFQEGDRFRVRVQSNAGGFLYVVARDAQGSFRLLYPNASGADATSHIGRFETRMVPERDWFAFDGNAGQERMYVFLSPKPMKEFERLLTSPGKAVRNSDLQKLTERADDNPSLAAEESGQDGDIGATYFVSEVNWKSDAVLRRFRFQNQGR